MHYLSDPQAIYRRSFDILTAETNFSGLPREAICIAQRLVHACGMPEITEDLRATENIAQAASLALASGRPIFADCTMVKSGIMIDRLAHKNKVICTLPSTSPKKNMTRSAAAVDAWKPNLLGSVIAIGNAPTALFRLLEILQEGGPRPAAIFGFPVGFVGAAEAKEALATIKHGIPFMTLKGRRGGSAMAAAAVNAIILDTQ
ncbi:MAG: precorrin-8X methylmutase [Rhodospirillaceae bacterium]|nr:precorrin-8X methylmutase [Rhodospirillaceae bacterium]|tara:strand:+ start:411 stop:1019 length:609 start_codon:yes stop_codon:yes gene_type:complete